MHALALARPDPRRWRELDGRLVDEPSTAVEQHVLCSSRGRPWNGVAVWLQGGPAEDLYIPAARKHSIVIRRGAPTWLLQSQGGEIVERLWRTGEAVLVPAGTPSFWRSDAARDNLHVNLCPQWLGRAAGAGHAPVPLRTCPGRDDPVLRSIGELLLDSLQSNASLRPTFADAIAIALATHLLEHHARTDALPNKTAGLTRRQLDRVRAAIDADLAEDWSLERLAALVSLSPFHFARAFKAACGETPHRFVMRLRLEHARRQVLATQQPLIDVAVEAGFASVSHFGQAFRAQWGMSPGQLRRSG